MWRVPQPQFDEASKWDRHWYLGWLMPEARKAWILDLTFEMGDRIEQGLHAVAGKAGCVGPTRAVKRPSEA